MVAYSCYPSTWQAETGGWRNQSQASGWRSCLKIINKYNKLTGFGDSESESGGRCVGVRHIHGLLESEFAPSTLVARGAFMLARK